ncbi:DUF805 domain-containing protein [Gallibacterium sp. AGMB14963]|uniref:DUF805 domain-containing protein n=1 Tax=Gallibacterium faecale TaxID=3019086 RepID=UPI0022F1826B|nr:DUF805 domain-containing protein [Gallibacterium sp. AGMB14963]MDA3978421.1 DUF805 domain-containing protein [Gallibacterium sp. AGMB14963]
MNWYLLTIKKYAVFQGRARRKEFWMFALFNILFSIILGIIDVLIGTYNWQSDTGLLSSIYSLFVILPNLAVTTRRLHDINRSGWWQLLYLIPIIGWLVLLYFFVSKGNIGTNRFGEDPKQNDLNTSDQTTKLVV